LPDKDPTGEVAQLLPAGPLRWVAWLIPHERTTERGMFKWRARMAITLVATSLVACSTAALAFGKVPWLFSGFASTQDVQQISQRVDRIDQRLLESNILDLRIRQCAASTTEARQLYASRLQPLLIEYISLTGKNYPLPACSDL
jgi:hypothetical protein